MSGRKNKSLTPKQSAFVREYLIDMNAKQAAIRAGYSKKTAEWQGPQLLGKTHVSEIIKTEMNKRAERLEVDADAVIKRLLEEADGNGPDTSSSARIKATELIGKYLGMFSEKMELTGKNGAPLIQQYDYTRLTSEERETLENILRKALPPTSSS